MFAISPTDINWFNFLKANNLNSYVNFWTPTPWNIKGLKENDRLYFMLKKPIRKIGGFGEFVEYKNITVEEAWNEFGYRNGRNSKREFLQSIPPRWRERYARATLGHSLTPLTKLNPVSAP